MRVIVIASPDIQDMFSICGAIARSKWIPTHVVTDDANGIGAKWAKVCNVPLTITADVLSAGYNILAILNTPTVPEIVNDASRRGYSVYIHRV